jgi:hypothetical protein
VCVYAFRRQAYPDPHRSNHEQEIPKRYNSLKEISYMRFRRRASGYTFLNTTTSGSTSLGHSLVSASL